MRKSVRFPSSIVVPLAVVCGVATMSYPSHARSEAPADQRASASRGKDVKTRKIYDDFQVAAGTALQIELRAPLSTKTSQAGDSIEARLQRAIAANEVELVPAGAVLFGKVTEASPAGPKTRGRLAFTFSIVQHAETGSHATIRSAPLTFEGEIPQRGKVPQDIDLPRGTNLTITLVAPLVVRIPVADPGRSNP